MSDSKTKLKEKLELLYREIYFAKSQYIVFELICKDFSKYENYSEINIAIIDALEYSIFSKLTKIYDKNKNSITLYTILSTIDCDSTINNNNPNLIKFAFDNKQKIDDMKCLEKLKTMRDKNIAHLDKGYPNGLKSLKFNEIINLKELENLINFAYNLIKDLLEKLYKIKILENKKFDIIKLQYNNGIKRSSKKWMR